MSRIYVARADTIYVGADSDVEAVRLAHVRRRFDALIASMRQLAPVLRDVDDAARVLTTAWGKFSEAFTHS